MTDSDTEPTTDAETLPDVRNDEVVDQAQPDRAFVPDEPATPMTGQPIDAGSSEGDGA